MIRSAHLEINNYKIGGDIIDVQIAVTKYIVEKIEQILSKRNQKSLLWWIRERKYWDIDIFQFISFYLNFIILLWNELVFFVMSESMLWVEPILRLTTNCVIKMVENICNDKTNYDQQKISVSAYDF